LSTLAAVVTLLLAAPSPSIFAQDQSSQLDAIAEEVEQIRGLRLKRDVEKESLTREQFRRRLQRTDTEHADTEEVRAAERTLVAFGLAPEGIDLQESEKGFVAEEVGGYYDPKTKKLYLIGTGGKQLSPLGESIYAHELTHALQDQHFDLAQMSEGLRDKNDDEAMAVSALIEGDATSVAYEYVRPKRGLRERIEQEQEKNAPDEELLRSTPPIIVETFYFPYDTGGSFVAALYSQGGNKGVDAAFRDPPRSTEQVLHPEKYLKRDQPARIRLPDLSTTLGAGWKQLDENTFGEFQIIVLLAGQEPTHRTWDAALTKAEGWDGDRYALYAAGDKEVVVWRTVWDSTKDAREFAAALRAYDEERFGSRYTDRDGVLQLTAAGQVAVLGQEGARVTYVLAPTAAVAGKVWGLVRGSRGQVPAGLPNSGGGGMASTRGSRADTP
jgi:hypothetical protein